MVVGFAADDGLGAVELLDEEEADELMGEGEGGEGELLGGGGSDGIGEAVGSADDEDEAAWGGGLFLLQPAGELQGAHLEAVLVEQHDVVAETEAGQQGLAFEVCLLVGAKMARVAESGQFLDGEGHVAGDALAVLPDELEQGLAGGLADDDELGLHTRTKLLFSSGFGTGC